MFQSFSKLILISLTAFVLGGQSTFAQSNKSSLGSDGLQDLYIVAGCGTAGAILGLSTLSFVDEPWDHSRNILMGAAVGIVAGVVVVAYSQANKSQGVMGSSSIIDGKEFSRLERLAVNSEVQAERAVSMKQDPIQLSVNFKF